MNIKGPLNKKRLFIFQIFSTNKICLFQLDFALIGKKNELIV